MTTLSQQQRRLLCLTAALCGVDLSLSSCKPAGPSPEALCAALETANGLASVVVSGTDLPASEVHLVLDSPVLDSFDKSTKRTSCTATFHPTFSGDLAAGNSETTNLLLGTGVLVNRTPVQGAKDLLEGRQSYTIQPAADGRGYVYTLGGNVVLALRAWAKSADVAGRSHTTLSNTDATATASSDHEAAPSTTSETENGTHALKAEADAKLMVLKGHGIKILPTLLTLDDIDALSDVDKAYFNDTYFVPGPHVPIRSDYALRLFRSSCKDSDDDMARKLPDLRKFMPDMLNDADRACYSRLDGSPAN